MRRIMFKSAFCVAAFSAGVAWGCVAEASEAASAPAPQAVTCTAAFDLMDRVAPNWTKEADVIKARTFWRSNLTTLVARTGSDAHTQVSQEMQTLANISASDPGVFSRTAVQCVADAPQKKRKRRGWF